MDFIWILFALVCGLGMKLVGLPPLIGYLLAGFALNFLGFEADSALQVLADLGITLMLFTIGLKLNVQDLFKVEVWAGSLSHMALWTGALGIAIFALSGLALPFFLQLDPAAAALLAFALSFSSTVCIVKLLEESGEMKTRHGKLAIGVLVMQDIAAVVFLVLATGKTPSLWALGLFALVFIRPLLGRLLNRAGHGELLPLSGFFFALGGYQLFELVGVKGDLGALMCGILLSQHPKASELSKALLSFKDLFLIGFFLSIGFTALPDWSMLGMAMLLSLLLPLKFLLFFFLFTGLQLRGRTAYLSALALANFSEFGLIVAALSVESGWLSREWLVIVALAVSLSFVFTSLAYRHAHTVYGHWKGLIRRFERAQRLPEDAVVQPRSAEVLVIGLGRVGLSAFQLLHDQQGNRVWGMDADRQRIERLQAQGRHVFVGDGEDADLWENLDISAIRLVMLALPSIEDVRHVAEQLADAQYQGKLAAIARYDDERAELEAAGIDEVYDFFAEAGTGFAEEGLQLLAQDG